MTLTQTSKTNMYKVLTVINECLIGKWSIEFCEDSAWGACFALFNEEGKQVENGGYGALSAIVTNAYLAEQLQISDQHLVIVDLDDWLEVERKVKKWETEEFKRIYLK